ncbi:adhesion G-protein coupled receptor G6-like isoform X3 [Denticeps clupeoides]|uniref:adhesion G-protein coupled receptor G6-like isoform X3 n=1 Tax=Denticeps clupeoides TaxID=299321 RepID=UPI0010A2C5E5|nr:adhesion G-protein coupled receptor G6 isoform X3 [Denticeps clupeoides]
MVLYIRSRWLRWKFRLFLPVALLLTGLEESAVLSCQSCNLVLTDPEGGFTSPCYPQNYPPSQSCKWTLQAPAGFVVQITFLDFDLEEAMGCIYDKVIVNMGSSEKKFCGLTANGLTLNSTGNVMEVTFSSDFSVQKKGFRISYKQVAVSLRNQKVTLPQNNKDIVKVASQVTLPTINHLTVCFEIARSSVKDVEMIFTLGNGNGGFALGFGKTLTGMLLYLDGLECNLDGVISGSDFTSSMKPFCLTWTKSTGQVALQFDGSYRTKTCSDTKGHMVKASSVFQLGGGTGSFDGVIYNFRLWSKAMTTTDLSTLSCDVVGDAIDWDNTFWDIPSGYAQTDSTLSCSTAISSVSSETTSCTSPGLGCPAALTSTVPSPVTTNTIATNAAGHAASTSLSATTSTPATPSTATALTATTTHAPTTPVSVTTSTVIQSIASSAPAATNTPPFSLAANVSSAAPLSATEATSVPSGTFPFLTPPPAYSTTPPLYASSAFNTPSTNVLSCEVVFYRISLAVNDAQSAMNETDVEEAVLRWLDLTFQGWTYSVYIDNVRVQSGVVAQTKSSGRRFNCQALLAYKNTSDTSLAEAEIESRMKGAQPIGNGLVLDWSTVDVQALENCQLEETPLHYKWPESRPTITQYVPCFPYKDQRASRNCSINLQNYTSFWSAPDLSNCQDIIDIEVSPENAAEVAVQLKDITNSELSPVEVSKVVTKVKELVNVARINATLATTVVSIISNVMTSSDSAQAAASRIALTAMDDLVQKVEFEGPSVTIFSKNLAVGITALNSSQFNGTSFSAFIPPNTTDPQVDFESEWQNPLAVVSLPATLLHNLSSADAGSASRINFMFFTRTGLFQDNQSNGYTLNSYVVASSVGNLSITNLQDPVVITITHLDQQESVYQSKRTCVFWDFTVNNGTGGWNSEGCRVSGESNANHTVCLCDHLTHFGILMDISGMAAQIDEKNTRILTFITYIGCGVSAIFSAATLLTYIAFEKLRRDYPSKILMNLSTSLLFLNMVFLLDSWLASFGIESVCVAAAVFLHFFLLTSFTWMGLESIHMYIALVKVFNTYIRRYILKFCLVGWGLPAAIVGTVVAINKDFYGKEYYGKSGDGKGASEFCWIKSAMVFYVTCVTYFSIIFLVNVAMFIVVMMQICGRNGKRSNRTLREEILRNLRSVFSLTFLLGMTWGFAFFAWGPVNLAFMYLFSIFNSLQGLFVFVFHCALKENVQKQWRRYLCCGKFQLADNSDWSKTATNNTKKVSSDNLGKSLSSSSFGSSTANWTSKAKATLNPFAKRSSNAGKNFSSQTSPKCSPSDGDGSSIIPVHQVLDKVKGYCSVHSDNFYKNIIMSESFSHSTKF